MPSATTSSAATSTSSTRGIRRRWNPSISFVQPASKWLTKWVWPAGSARQTSFWSAGTTAGPPPSTSPLHIAPSLGLSAPGTRNALKNKEANKIAKFRHIFADNTLDFVPLALTTFGDVAPEAAKFLDKAAEVHSQHNNEPHERCRHQLLQNLQVSVLTEVGKRLLAAGAAGIDTNNSAGVGRESDSATWSDRRFY